MSSQTTHREFTIKAPEFAYAQLDLATDGEPGRATTTTTTTLDELLVRSYCAGALRQFLGDTGAGIPVDVLKVDPARCWVRVPRDDLGTLAAALTAYRGSVADGVPFLLRVGQCSDWLGTMVGSEALDKLWQE
ncbi:hypothetical protein ISF_02138 [Cordyceps fumosorosea ARSEF 2679]|uniref:Ribonucleases P/MRP subunit Pop8-like domain-containing protein n=1 Tax=Cordyceps fumosorosea (strain ARSEF 2679) TaxID=1081104 RepID=A0A168CNA1_CORFA|nr:hypothetical protein ISF_02138 [Cordyceps fumosorosea ARSEF 2679]OAA71587.1 hypothetical protein ISF_02138 [Cordyceps fumosorosea ARSEF 2679]